LSNATLSNATLANSLTESAVNKQCTLAVRVTPHASSNAIVGWKDNVLAVRVTAVAEDGKANAALLKLLSKQFAIPKSAIQIVRGHTARQTILSLEMSPEALNQCLATLL
jgi:uncharacterized protein (TIGR00251 family)